MIHRLNNTEITLIEAFQKGEKSADECIFRRFYRPLLCSLDKITMDRQLSEKIVADIFIQLFNNRHRMADIAAVREFTAAAAHTICTGVLADEKKLPLFPLPGKLQARGIYYQSFLLEMMRWEVVQLLRHTC